MPPGTLSLKQRLSALSLSTSSPSAYDTDNSDSSFRTTLRRKAQAHAPWLRKESESFRGPPTAGDIERVQQVLPRMIFQAGVDYEVVLNASALPDPNEVSYDLLLSRILAYLDLYVEADYTVVFFASGNKHTPGWNWVWKAYRSLSRKYRKNLKQLYIVHSSWFSKMLFSLAGAIISPKFFSKIVYVSTLSELAYYVPLTQIDIPAGVYKENLKYEDRITLPIPTRSNVFGVALEDLMGYEGEKGGLPRVVRDCIAYLHQAGLLEEGIFRRSPSSALLRAAQDAYDRGNVVSLETFGDPNLAAVLLKKFLRDLPEPIFPESLYPIIAAIMYLRDTLLPSLAPCAFIVLSHILQLMYDVAQRSDVNKMGDYNLAIVLTPNLVKGSNPMRDVAVCAVRWGPRHSQRQHCFPQSSRRTDYTWYHYRSMHSTYYEIFDELHDPAEPVGSPSGSSHGHSQPSFLSSQMSSLSPLSTPSEASYQQSLQNGSGVGSPPSAWSVAGGAATSSGKRHRTTPSAGTAQTIIADSKSIQGQGGVPTHGRAKSLVSVEKGSGLPGHRKGTISIGRGTKKTSGAVVEAMGVTAEGFFSPPKEAPPVPPRSTKPTPDLP
ncbi:hypothetical protein FA13DRAFT_1743366 [Coprinellus micaceus]|uniref:Rho-GAP domain-containing protein n=1 Tax=Coprinellus micaceus TaxID=71717 RepID=A0A4Y7SF49_COPMI|nr:hypothetical protein FA13DRAFT_1743366 [Coprinellus micaceus]